MTPEERALIEEIREQNRQILALLQAPGGPAEPIERIQRREDLMHFARNPEQLRAVYGGRRKKGKANG